MSDLGCPMYDVTFLVPGRGLTDIVIHMGHPNSLTLMKCRNHFVER